MVQDNSRGEDDQPTTRSANLLPSSELADTSLGMVAAAIFVMLIDDVLDAMMQLGFTASERDLNSDCFSCTFSETASGGDQADSIRAPRYLITSMTMSTSWKPLKPSVS